MAPGSTSDDSNSRPDAEPEAQPGAVADAGTDRDETDFWPMFWSSVHAALLTIVAEFAFTFYIALQWGINIEIRLWKGFLPVMAMVTERPVFEAVIRWASLATAVVLAVFSLMAFFRGRRLQVQAGRAFAWIDFALIGALHLTRSWWFDDSLSPASWMWALLGIGLIGFAVAMAFVKIDYTDREEERREREEIERQEAARAQEAERVGPGGPGEEEWAA